MTHRQAKEIRRWELNADRLALNGAPYWMIAASRKYAKRLRDAAEAA